MALLDGFTKNIDAVLIFLLAMWVQAIVEKAGITSDEFLINGIHKLFII